MIRKVSASSLNILDTSHILVLPRPHLIIFSDSPFYLIEFIKELLCFDMIANNPVEYKVCRQVVHCIFQCLLHLDTTLLFQFFPLGMLLRHIKVCTEENSIQTR